jgi:hypothetical protein
MQNLQMLDKRNSFSEIAVAVTHDSQQLTRYVNKSKLMLECEPSVFS